ncbi:MAG TPA: SGNH/GDSL hydrolase family protein [Nannocystaceae bacterium]|nr:SGNH/GDSL hydrolase family protein [Nannocystaceae bacterium]
MRAAILLCSAWAIGCAGERRDGGSATTVTSVATTAPSAESGGSESSSADDSSGGSTGVASTSATTEPSTHSGSSSTTGSSDAGDDTTTGGPIGLPSLGSLVVLGDSISDGGGQPPYYYALLRDDLDAHYGGIEYVNNAESGSETGDLLGQVNGLPDALPGPVAVVITSGGNDMKSAIQQIVIGADGPARTAMQGHVAAALDALLAPNRFGAGVEVFVFEGNIYDASDGAGDFGAHDCAFGGGLPAIPTDPIFENWNSALAETIADKGQTSVDMHAWFYGHGYASAPSWYAGDCTHPSTVGHEELQKLFHWHITGETI